MQNLYGKISLLFDCWADPVVHLLILNSYRAICINCFIFFEPFPGFIYLVLGANNYQSLYNKHLREEDRSLAMPACLCRH